MSPSANRSAIRLRPSQTRAFRVVLFAVALLIFLFSYLLGQRYRGPELQLRSATPVADAQPMELHRLRSAEGQPLPPQWYLLYTLALDEGVLRSLSRSYNRLAESAELQGRFRLLLATQASPNLPAFAVEFSDPDGEINRWCRQLDPAAVCQGLYLIDPGGRLKAIFSTSADPSEIAADFKTLIEHEPP